MKWVCVLALASVSVGCGAGAASDATVPAATETPAEAVAAPAAAPAHAAAAPRRAETAAPKAPATREVTLPAGTELSLDLATAVASDAPITRMLSGSIEQVLGRPAEMICHPAWPDTPVFNDVGVQAVTFGPGSTACYWPDEHVEIDDFLNAIKIYALTALRACSTKV